MIPLLAASLILRGVVDQMDSGIAAIEWTDESISYLPLSALPAKTAEGDALVFRVRAVPLRRALRDSTVVRRRGRHSQHALLRGTGRER